MAERGLHDARTSRQIGLFEAQESIASQFARYHRRHPEVFDRLVLVCRQYRERRPGGRWSINAAFEVARWYMVIERDGDDDFKLNNNYRAEYARLILEHCADLAAPPIFETRRLRRDE